MRKIELYREDFLGVVKRYLKEKQGGEVSDSAKNDLRLIVGDLALWCSGSEFAGLLKKLAEIRARQKVLEKMFVDYKNEEENLNSQCAELMNAVTEEEEKISAKVTRQKSFLEMVRNE